MFSPFRGLILLCIHCGRNLHRPEKLNKHLLRNLCPKQYKCDHCNIYFHTSTLLRGHNWDAHDDV